MANIGPIPIPIIGQSLVRIGLIANNQNDCETCGSCIGFGTEIRSCAGYDLTSTSCGTSKAGCDGSPNENKAAFGYILVQ